MKNEPLQPIRVDLQTFDSLPLPVMLCAADGQIVFLNRAWIQWSGYTLKEIPTLADWLERAGKGSAPQTQAAFKSLYALDEYGQAGEYPITLHNGSRRTCDLSLAPLGRLPDGRQVWLCSLLDRTERQQALLESEQRFELAVEGSNAGVWDVRFHLDDPTLPDEIYLSPRLKSFIGYSDQEFPNSIQAWQGQILPEDLESVHRSSEEHQAGRQPFHEVE